MQQLISTSLLLLFSIFATAQIELPAPLKDRPSLILHHTGYTVSYNTAHGTPNWSAWVLTKAHVQNGTLTRSNQFLADPSVPIAYRVTPSDYTNSGYDRGHMCPAADMQWSATAMKESFFMSNMCPQIPALNRVCWKQLEDACRKWTLTEDTLYIVCGPVYRPPYKRIGRTHHIDVPTGFYKVILSLRRGHAKAIGFYYQNNSMKQPFETNWNPLKPFETYGATSVDAIEKITGIDFFSSLPDSIENALEMRFNLKDWR